MSGSRVGKIDEIISLFNFNSISVAKKNQEHEEIRKKIEETSSLIEATDAAMAKTTTESHVLGTELKAKLRDHERQTKRKMELEEKVLEALQDNISSDQASRARARNVRELQNKRRERELIMFSTEEQLSKLMYELEKLKGIVAGNRARMDELMVRKLIYGGVSAMLSIDILQFHETRRKKNRLWTERPTNTTAN